MKKLAALLLFGALATTAVADIQSPPGSMYTPIRKLSRGLANIFYSPAELISTFENTLKTQGGREAFSYGIISGLDRAGIRLGYGFYEVINFRCPNYKGSYRSALPSTRFDTVHGYTEFPPTIGFETTYVTPVRKASFMSSP